jgi:hypothetical protein
MSPISSTLANASAYGYRTFAAAAGTAYESIASATTSGVVGAVSFGPGIAQTYASLQLRISARSNAAGTGNSALYLNFGGSSTSYAYHALNGDGATPTGSATASTANAYLGLIPNNGNTSGIFGTIIIDIYNYASTTNFKTIRAYGGYDANGTGNARLSSALWQSTTAIGSGSNFIDIYGVGDFISGCTFSLYGIRGA